MIYKGVVPVLLNTEEKPINRFVFLVRNLNIGQRAIDALSNVVCVLEIKLRVCVHKPWLVNKMKRIA